MADPQTVPLSIVSSAGRILLPPPSKMYSPDFWMNGTSEARQSRNSRSVAASLSATSETNCSASRESEGVAASSSLWSRMRAA